MSRKEKRENVGFLYRIPFSLKQEKDIRTMANYMKISGFITILSGALTIILQVMNGKTGAMFAGVLPIFFGSLLVKGAKSFHLMATTDDADQKHLADGFQQLQTIFLVKSVLMIFALSIGLLVLMVLLSFGGAMLQKMG